MNPFEDVCLEILDRAVAMQKECMAALNKETDAVPYFLYTSATFPYWINRLSGEEPEDLDTDNVLINYTLASRMIVAHLTEGYQGDSERILYQMMPGVTAFFTQRPYLNSGAYPERMDYLHPNGITFNGGRGLSVFEDGSAGAGSKPFGKVGTEYTWVIPVVIPYREAY